MIRRYVWNMDIHPTAHVAASALIDRTWPRGVHIGPDVLIDEEAVLLTHDLTRGLYCDTRIGARTIIGARAIILPGVSVGADCIIAPGTVVNRDVADGCCVSGNPMMVAAPDGAGGDAPVGAGAA
ncbi:MAG: acyltransferase [Sphingopyxis sp.]